MKRICCLCLAVLITALCCIIPASAADADISPALQQMINEKDENETADILLWFSDETLSIDKMPSWPEYEAGHEHAEYLREHNRELLSDIFSQASCSFYHYALSGCAIAYDVPLKDIGIIAQNEHVRAIDIDDESGYDGGFQFKDNKISPKLKAVLRYTSPDDYLFLCVGNAAHIKTLGEMPSYPSERMDRDEFNRRRAQAIEEYKAYIAEVEETFFTAFDGIDAVFRLTGFGFMTGVCVKAADVEKIAESELVRYVEYFENAWEEIVLEDTPDDPPLLGDADMDGEVTVIDSTWIQRFKAGFISEDKIDLACADVDGDEQVTVMDATLIQKALASLCTIEGIPLS